MARIALSVLIVVSTLWGCAYQAPLSRSINEQMVKELRRGATTKDEVLKIFGNPARVSVVKGMERWTYLGEIRGPITAAPPVPSSVPNQTLSKAEVPVLAPPRGRSPVFTGVRRQELVLQFKDDVLVEYRLREF